MHCSRMRGVLNERVRKPVEIAARNSVAGERSAVGGCSGALVVDGRMHDVMSAAQA